MSEWVEWIKVGSIPFQVKRVDGFAAQADVSGTCGPETQEILLDSKLGPDIELITILHEALHGGWANTVLKELFSDKQEEQVLRGLDSLIYSIIRDNPEFVRQVQARGA